MLPKGAGKLHWRDMGARTKACSIERIAAFDAVHIVVMARDLVLGKQERARRKCLETMLLSLEAIGVSRYVLESRGRSKDKLDVALLLSMRAKGLCGSIDLTHEIGRSESRLWIPDQVLGAYGDAHCGLLGDELEAAWGRLRLCIDEIEINL